MKNEIKNSKTSSILIEIQILILILNSRNSNNSYLKKFSFPINMYNNNDNNFIKYSNENFIKTSQ